MIFFLFGEAVALLPPFRVQRERKVYEVTGRISLSYFKGYTKLRKEQQVEWNNRGFSTFHALLAAAISFYLVVLSDLFRDDGHDELVINRHSTLSNTILGVSIGYFLADLGMILWCFPALGGKEYVVHHGLSMYSILLALMSGQAQIYILMVLFTEITTPFVNLRWYLDVAGQKSSKLYVYNGIALFVGWLVARVLLFIFFFTHMYLHFDQVKMIFPLGFYSILMVPPMISLLNLFWFWKILKGLIKTLSKARHKS
ncbi:uncharacterized protein LOC131223733 isoform X2 [Magnolia sinica]|uniref:uncharacterized protein LOC131223733 isoform X2 n=1 Tax=Magnolia sinica TaxID=86752 RepID=UPI00265B6D45|nr:uncharacterized protein LOC131223733 isoform X2 [Magnolia sinica]